MSHLHGQAWVDKGGRTLVIRPICPDDEPLMTRFHEGLSPESVYTRYFNVLKLRCRTAHERLCRVCHPDPDAEAVFVAESATPDGVARQIVGVGRLSKLPDANTAEVSLIVSDCCQGQGVGTELMHRLVEIAKGRGLDRVTARILTGNVAMQHICLAAGMRLSERPEGGEIHAEVDLRADSALSESIAP